MFLNVHLGLPMDVTNPPQLPITAFTFFHNKTKQGLHDNQIICSLAIVSSSYKKVTYFFYYSICLKIFHINFKCYLEKLTIQLNLKDLFSVYNMYRVIFSSFL